MKTTPIIAVLSALALASCAQDEPVTINRADTIGFRPAMGTQSRSTETTNANLTSIMVGGFIDGQLYFPDTEFKKGADAFFVSSPAYRWPGDDSELSFYAYSPANPGGTVNIASDARTVTDFSPAEQLADQVDFITATATGTKSVNEVPGVELTFNHQLSQIEVRAKSENTVYTFAISGVRIGEPVSQASYDFDSSAWTLGSANAIYEESYTTPKTVTDTAQSVMGAGGNAMLIPQQLVAWNPETDASNTAKGAYLSVKLNVRTTETGVQIYPFPSDGNCQWAAIPIDTDWQAGKKYIYTLDLTNGAGYVDPHDPQPGKPVLGGPIKFTVDVVDWVDTPVDLDMNTK